MTYWKLFSKLKSVISLFTCFYITLKVSYYQQGKSTHFKINHDFKCFSLPLKLCKYDCLNTHISTLRASGKNQAAYQDWDSNRLKGSPVITANHLGANNYYLKEITKLQCLIFFHKIDEKQLQILQGKMNLGIMQKYQK